MIRSLPYIINIFYSFPHKADSLRYGQRYPDRRAAFARGNGQLALAHHFKPVFDVVQSDMRVLRVGVAGGIEAHSVVLRDDLDGLVRLPCFNGNMYRIAAFTHSVLDGVLNDRPESQRRNAERPVRRIEVDKEIIFKLRLIQI